MKRNLFITLVGAGLLLAGAATHQAYATTSDRPAGPEAPTCVKSPRELAFTADRIDVRDARTTELDGRVVIVIGCTRVEAEHATLRN